MSPIILIRHAYSDVCFKLKIINNIKLHTKIRMTHNDAVADLFGFRMNHNSPSNIVEYPPSDIISNKSVTLLIEKYEECINHGCGIERRWVRCKKTK